MGYIRCVTCGKVIGHLYEKAAELRISNFTEIEIYQKFGLNRTCCRYHLTSGFKMPMAKYLDENARLDLDEDENSQLDVPRENTDKINSIKNRLSKMRSQLPASEIVSDIPKERSNVKRNPFFVAT